MVHITPQKIKLGVSKLAACSRMVIRAALPNIKGIHQPGLLQSLPNTTLSAFCSGSHCCLSKAEPIRKESQSHGTGTPSSRSGWESQCQKGRELQDCGPDRPGWEAKICCQVKEPSKPLQRNSGHCWICLNS